jgi:hypothetical protein
MSKSNERPPPADEPEVKDAKIRESLDPHSEEPTDLVLPVREGEEPDKVGSLARLRRHGLR